MIETALLEKLDTIASALKLGRPSLWSIQEIAAYYGCCDDTVREQMICKRGFPIPVKVTAGGRRWVPEEVVDWILKHREVLPEPRRKRA